MNVQNNAGNTLPYQEWKSLLRKAMDECEQALFKYKIWQQAHPGFKPEQVIALLQDQHSIRLRPEQRADLTAKGQAYAEKQEDIEEKTHSLRSLAQECFKNNPTALAAGYRHAKAREHVCMDEYIIYAAVQSKKENEQDLALCTSAHEVRQILAGIYEANKQASTLRFISYSLQLSVLTSLVLCSTVCLTGDAKRSCTLRG